MVDTSTPVPFVWLVNSSSHTLSTDKGATTRHFIFGMHCASRTIVAMHWIVFPSPISSPKSAPGSRFRLKDLQESMRMMASLLYNPNPRYASGCWGCSHVSTVRQTFDDKYGRIPLTCITIAPLPADIPSVLSSNCWSDCWSGDQLAYFVDHCQCQCVLWRRRGLENRPHLCG